MKALTRALDALFQVITIVLLLSLAVLVVYAVVSRKLGSPIPWYDEVAVVLLAWLTFYGAGLAALRRAHLGFTGLLYALPLPVRTSLFIFAEAVVFTFLAVMAWYGWDVLKVMRYDALITLPWVPVALVQSVIPIGCALFILSHAISLPGAWVVLRAGQDPERLHIEDAIAEAERERDRAS